MNTRTQKKGASTPIPAGLRKLWREAKGWVAWLLTAVDRSALPASGISREEGAKLSIWLMNIEGAVRRLILAAALSFTLPPKPSSSGPTRGSFRPLHLVVRKHPATRRAGFCVFRIAAVGDGLSAIPSQLARTKKAPAYKPFGHIPFPADPLLSLGITSRPRPAVAPFAATARMRHPLDRWVRPSRRDPDWMPDETHTDMFEPRERGPERKRQKRRAPRRKYAPCDPSALQVSLHDWRRRYDEWQKLVPAPDLAARLDALGRIAANPTATITGVARRLVRVREQALKLARVARPRTRAPRRAAHLYTGHRRIDLPDRCQAAVIAHADTS